jgi:ribosome-associated protein
LWFDVVNSPSLAPEQKDGVLRVISQQARSQAANRELAVERFVELLQHALGRVSIRKKTQVSRAAKERRLEEKRQRSVLKRERSEGVPVED